MAALEGARKTAEAKVVSLAPDVCKTPMGSATPPIPYSIVAKLHLSQMVSPDVNYTKMPAFNVGSHTSKVWGDEAGTATGVKSGTVGDKAEPIGKSSTVRVNGKWAIRHDDLFHMNNKNTVGKLVYPGAGSAPCVSGAGLSPVSVPGGSLNLLSKRGIMGQLSGIGKQLAMDVVMGKDPINSLKAMVNPLNIIQGQLGGLLQKVGGPIGGMVGQQVLGKVMSSLSSPQRKSPSVSEITPPLSLFNNSEVAAQLLRQAGQSPEQVINDVQNGHGKHVAKHLQKTSISKAIKEIHHPTSQAKALLSDFETEQKSWQVTQQITQSTLALAKQKVLSPKRNWRQLFK